MRKISTTSMITAKGGDVCEIDIEQVGVLRNPIKNEPGA